MSGAPFDARLRVLLITPELDAVPLETVERALAGGIRAVQLRDKRAPSRKLWQAAAALRELTARFNALLFVNGRVDIAAACRADGVHLGQAELPPADARRLLGPAALIGCSAHVGDDVRRFDGADFLTYSPIFVSPGKGEPIGTAALGQFAARAGLPVLALGGVGAANAGDVMQAGAAGVAVIREIFDARDPAASAAALCARVQEGLYGAKSAG